MLVVIESPYRGTFLQRKPNVRYARACVLDSIKRGESPIAFHLLYTQDGILNDNIPTERATGFQAAERWYKVANLCAVYTDRGISDGMKEGIEKAKIWGVDIEYRTLDRV